MLPVQLGIAPSFLELTQLLHVSMVDNCLSYQILPACHGQQVSSYLASLLSWWDLQILIADHLGKQPLLCGIIIPRDFKFQIALHRRSLFPEWLGTSHASESQPGAGTILPAVDKSSVAFVQIPWRQAIGVVTSLATSCTSTDSRRWCSGCTGISSECATQLSDWCMCDVI